MTHGEYARALKPLLPREAFEPAPRKLILACVHLAVIVLGWVSFRIVSPTYWPLISLAIGHSLACVAFCAHELTHGIVTRNKRVINFFEPFFWGLNFIPPTMWRRLHNESHHVTPNGENDPDRRFTIEEKSPATIAYTAVFYPTRWLKYNFLCLLHFLTYIGRHALAVFYPGDTKPAINTFKPHYSASDRLRIFREIGIILLLQGLIFLIAGRSWTAYLWAGPLAFMFTSMIVMIYIFTNHFLNPLGNEQDPLAATTSVIVPELFNRIHFNFSFHTEHHLFPTVNSEYYPLVSKLLQEKFGPHYNRLAISEAWSRLWSLEFFAPSFQEAPENRKAMPYEELMRVVDRPEESAERVASPARTAR
jgi:fatty acid desaturase